MLFFREKLTKKPFMKMHVQRLKFRDNLLAADAAVVRSKDSNR